MKQPQPRGPVSSLLLDILNGPEEVQPGAANPREELAALTRDAIDATEDFAFDDDLQLTLFCLFELHYSGIDGTGADWEWHPDLIAVRRLLEQAYESQLRAATTLPDLPSPTSADVAAGLFELTGADGGPSMSRYVAKQATEDQIGEFLIQKSIYTLKEADPHTWAIPRLTGRAKAALVEIQADEYGGGAPDRMHAALYAQSMRGVGLNDSYGYYLDTVPAITLASSNLMSLFGLNRRLRGAIVGHLAAYEMTSSLANRMYARGFRRLGYDDAVAAYFDEHVEADAVHEQIASRDMAGGLVESDPELLEDVFFGAAAAAVVDTWMTGFILDAWNAGTSSLTSSAAVPA
ncbi:iron-containing redox enzyme family protein [Arthrobacter sp. AET 35A]|uniref:iron-containing redox enzyme family protein n=1 Tax=Arthrobacter sp. AET 35A TaxID=2292643 RepID=UPI00177ACF52|nr:iron-containing redox enzyme family protein [Arthrobacter sp. AET 35A]MBE0011310.1 iron-containing redox enzyme family protein [Arthrobacter sp. AET 35A]